MKVQIHSVKALIVDKRAREWCLLPYSNHPKGCPNFGRRLSCPPLAPMVEEYFDLGNYLWFVSIEFDLGEHIRKMLNKHPEWSERQAKCCLYWQGRVNKELVEATEKYSYTIWGSHYTLCPEAMGVQVIETARGCGIPIATRPRKRVFKIAMIGYPPNFSFEKNIINRSSK